MKLPLRLFQITILAALTTFALSGCGKKDSAPESTETGLSEAEVAAAETEIAASEASIANVEAAEEASAAEEAAEAAEIAAAETAARAEEAAATVAAEAAAEAAEAKARAEEEAASAQAQAAAAAAAEKAAAEAAAAEAAADSIQAQAAEMLAKYSGEIDVLKANVSKLGEIVDSNADALPAGVAEKYTELKTLVPEVSSMVQSLKDYQGTDLTNLVSKIETDYSKATDLYKGAMALVPGNLSLDDVKVPGM